MLKQEIVNTLIQRISNSANSVGKVLILHYLQALPELPVELQENICCDDVNALGRQTLRKLGLYPNLVSSDNVESIVDENLASHELYSIENQWRRDHKLPLLLSPSMVTD